MPQATPSDLFGIRKSSHQHDQITWYSFSSQPTVSDVINALVQVLRVKSKHHHCSTTSDQDKCPETNFFFQAKCLHRHYWTSKFQCTGGGQHNGRFDSGIRYMERATLPCISFHCQNGSYAACALEFASLIIIIILLENDESISLHSSIGKVLCLCKMVCTKDGLHWSLVDSSFDDSCLTPI